jgi:hypothetical protein
MTVRNVGGCLIDLTTRAHESDQLSAYYPGRRAFTFSGIELKSEASSSVDTDGNVSATGKGTLVVTSPGTDGNKPMESELRAFASAATATLVNRSSCTNPLTATAQRPNNNLSTSHAAWKIRSNTGSD